MWVRGLDWAGPGRGQVVDAFECGNESSGSIKKLAPSSILREAKVAYYARNMFEAGRFVLFFVKAT